VARALKAPSREVLQASTGIIGSRLPVLQREQAVPQLVAGLSRANHRAAARAMMTTDRVPKEAAVAMTVNGRTVRVGGMAKGAGMIAPSMATMLCVITTDAAMAPALLRQLLRQATEQTFNRISVDGDMSTNDSVFALASGASGVRVRRGTPSARRVAHALEAVAARLAKAIVEDGEGAARIMEVEVIGARSDAEAQACARRVAYSPLTKTMLAGGDPNVGRIGAAVGASQVHVDPARLEISIGNRRVVSRGTAVSLTDGVFRGLLLRPEVRVRINLHAGRSQGRMLTCDLTTDYVRINAGYARVRARSRRLSCEASWKSRSANPIS
jgi:glutamate N-acetyltransferase/amino-acid N-acetyltransferase